MWNQIGRFQQTISIKLSYLNYDFYSQCIFSWQLWEKAYKLKLTCTAFTDVWNWRTYSSLSAAKLDLQATNFFNSK